MKSTSRVPINQGWRSAVIKTALLQCVIQMKAIKEYLPVILFRILYTMVLTFDSREITWLCEIKAIEQYFPIKFFNMLSRMVLTFEYLDPHTPN